MKTLCITLLIILFAAVGTEAQSGKIQMSELAVVLFGCFIVGVSGCFSRIKEAKRQSSIVTNGDATSPFPRILAPIYSFISRSVCTLYTDIANILSSCAFTEILQSIVKRISVSMISLFSSTAAKERTMHRRRYVSIHSPASSTGVKTFGRFTPMSLPIPPRKRIKILVVNNRKLATSKRNKAVRFIERLGDCVAFHAAGINSFWHRSSWKGLLQFSRYSTIAAMCLLFFVCPSAFPQSSTTVTIGPITDAGGVVWANGSWTLGFVGQPNSSWPGGGLAKSFTGALNASGSATQSTPSNATITPNPSFWNLTVCPAPSVTAGPSGCISQQFTVSGATQTLSITPPAIVITVPTSATQINPVVAYADAEISGGWVGFSYFNVTSAANRVCTAVGANGCTTWGAGGGVTFPVGQTPNIKAIFAADPAYGVKADVQVANGALVTFTNASTTIVCTNCFTVCPPAGTVIQGTNTSTDTGIASATTGAVALARTTTISCSDASHVLVNGVGAIVNGNGSLAWGTDDTTAWTNAWAAVVALKGVCGGLIAPAGYSFIQKAAFNTRSAYCTTADTPSFSETAGHSFVGQGAGTTVLIPTTDFDFTTCTGGTGTTCFMAGVMQAHDWGINGLFNSQATLSHNVILVGPPRPLANVYYHDISLSNWDGGDTNANNIGLLTGDGDFTRIFVQGFGGHACSSSASGEVSNYRDGVCGNTLGTNLTCTGLLNSSGMIYGQVGTGTALIQAGSGCRMNMVDDFIFGGAAAGDSSILAQAGSTVNLNGVDTGTNGASQFGLNINGGTVRAQNTILTGSTNYLVLQASGAFFDQGGNTHPTGTYSFVSGTYTGANSINGTTITAAKLVLSAGWGASAAWTALTGQTRLIQGTITNTGAGQGANPTITYTFPTPFTDVSSVVCNAVQVGGNQPLVATANFTPSALSATGVTFTYNGTPTVNDTEIVQISCDAR